MQTEHTLSVQVYYEDTDHSGVVYHANYLRYFERAREHLLGVQHLVDLYKNHRIGFVVYKADLTYKKGAEFGDSLTIKTAVELESEFRLIFKQKAILSTDQSLLVSARIELVCVGADRSLTKLPAIVIDKLQEKQFI